MGLGGDWTGDERGRAGLGRAHQRRRSGLGCILSAYIPRSLFLSLSPNAPPSSMLACMTPQPVPTAPSLKRPRGIWKQRQARAPPSPWPNQAILSHDRIASFLRPSSSPRPTSPSNSHLLCSPSSSRIASSVHPDDSDDDDLDARSISSRSSSKRPRLSPHFASDSDFTLSPSSGSAHPSSTQGSLTPLSDLQLYNAPPPLLSSMITMPPASISRVPSQSSSPAASLAHVKHFHSADYEDWENLKELFARAADRYDGTSLLLSRPTQPLLPPVLFSHRRTLHHLHSRSLIHPYLAPPHANSTITADDIPEALPLLRAVIRECHRFLLDHPDPSAVYADPQSHRSSRSPDAITPTEERLARDWTDADSAGSPHWLPRRRSTIHAAR